MLAFQDIASARIEVNAAALAIMVAAAGCPAIHPVAGYQAPKGVFLDGCSLFRSVGGRAAAAVERFEVALNLLKAGYAEALAKQESHMHASFRCWLKTHRGIERAVPGIRKQKHCRLL